VKVRTVLLAGALSLLLGLPLISAAAPGKDKEKEPAGQSVDSGSFGVFMGGRRVATETFSIAQNGSGSVVTSEFKSEQGVEKALQSSELRLSPAGEIVRYEWKETSPEKIQAVVEPNNDFLIERTTTNPEDKPAEQPFLLPVSTSVLDDYFFVQREVLLWKYLATGCRQDKGRLACPLGQRTQFGTLNPHSRASTPVSVQFSGREKVTIRGVEQELSRFELKSDAGDWAAWLDDQFKLIRILVADANTEVVRD
jgi:hypothetical protein